jgi:hypothetical protein
MTTISATQYEAAIEGTRTNADHWGPAWLHSSSAKHVEVKRAVELANPEWQPEPAKPPVETTGDICDRCGSTEFRDFPIHDGASVGRDCAHCRRTWGFPVWYGQPSEAPEPPLHLPAPEDYAEMQDEIWQGIVNGLPDDQLTPEELADRQAERSERERRERIRRICSDVPTVGQGAKFFTEENAREAAARAAG